jgi:signal peptidase I
MSVLLTAMIALNTIFTGYIPMPALAEVTPVQSENPDTGNTAVSRIAAIGTNTIGLSTSGDVLVSGTPSELTVYEATEKAHTGTITYPYTMTEGGYFLLNDHRAVDIDSRQFGEIKKDALLGKVILVIRWKGF